MNIVVDQLLVNYQLSGKGKLVLILHGWGDAAKGLSGLQKELSKKYQVLTPDLPGFGASQSPGEAWDLDNYSNFLGDLLAKLELAQPYALIGHSNGGSLAIRATSLAKLKPQKLILMASAGIRAPHNVKRLILKILAKTGDIATLWMPEKYRQALRKSLYGAAGSDMMVAPHLEETFKKTVRQDVQVDAAKLNLPTLLINAREDEAIPLSDGQRYMHLINKSHLEIVDNAGHFVHLDQPLVVYNLIEEFLS